MYVCICVRVCMYVCMFACMYECMCECMHVCIYLCMQVCNTMVVTWSPLSETGQKSDSMFATIIRTALYKTILFTLFRREFFQYPDAFKNWGGGVYLKRIHNKITKPMSYHYCYYATDNETCGQILALALAVCV